MTAFTKEIGDKIVALGQALKLQLDFAAAADFGNPAEQLAFGEKNTKTASLMIELFHELDIKAYDNLGILDEIVAYAEKNGSSAGDVLKEQAAKLRVVTTELEQVARQRMKEGKPILPADISAAFKKHLKP